MEGEKRERSAWKRLHERDSNRLLDLISEINRLLPLSWLPLNAFFAFP
jgi:hypothetical protein